jgi:hypothetical protein
MPVVLICHWYVYVPLPPAGVEPAREAGVVPVQIIWSAVIVLAAMTGETVICRGADELLHPPDVTVLL